MKAGYEEVARHCDTEDVQSALIEGKNSYGILSVLPVLVH